MQYNTQRNFLVMPEYGRCIQDMVEIASAIEDRDERTRCAYSIIEVMARLLHEQKGQPDFQNKLWNHLARISHYELDIDYPVEIVPEDQALAHPQPLPYPMKRIRRRHYGYHVEDCLKRAAAMPDGPERDTLIKGTANQMKQNLFIWNRDAMDDGLIAHDIEAYTEGKVCLDLNNFRFGPVQTGTSPLVNNGGKRKKKK